MDQEDKILAEVTPGADEVGSRSLPGNLFVFFTSTTGLMVSVLLLTLLAIPASVVAGLAARMTWWGLKFGWSLLEVFL